MTRKITFPNEYSLHKFTQNNLEKLFNLKFIASEIQLDSLRFDNLAFDCNNNSFVIIEYKNVLDPNVLSQVTEYYWLLREKPDEYINRADCADIIDLSKTRVMVIGPEFSPKQIEESENMDFPVELWKATLFKRKKNDGFVSYENLSNGCEVEIDIDLSCLKLTQDDLLEGKSPEITRLFLSLKERLCSEFEDLKMRILVDAVSFRVNNNLICISHVKNSIKTHFFMQELNDSENRTRDISDLTTGHCANFEMTITDESEIDYFIEIFRQAYDYKSACIEEDADLFESLDSENRKFIRHKQGKFQLTKTIDKKRYSLGTYDSLEEAMTARDELLGKNESLSNGKVQRKEGKYGRYIAFHNKSFRVHKSINGKQRFFGAFATVEEAKMLRDLLIENDWDTDKIPQEYFKRYIVDQNVERHHNIRKVKGKYVVSKIIDGKLEYFGTYDTKEEAIEAKEKLLNNDWHEEPDTSEEKVDEYIYQIGDEYLVKNNIEGIEKIFGRFDDMIEAIKFRNLCVRNNWKI